MVRALNTLLTMFVVTTEVTSLQKYTFGCRQLESVFFFDLKTALLEHFFPVRLAAAQPTFPKIVIQLGHALGC